MIEIQINTEAMERALDKAAAGLQDTEPLMRMVAARLHRAVDDNFSAGGRPKWAGIKRPGQVLVDTGHLRNSITEQSDSHSAVVGTNVSYAPYLHYGTQPYTIRPKKQKRLYWAGARHPVKQVQHPGLKARPFMMLADGDEADLVDSVQDYLAVVCGLS